MNIVLWIIACTLAAGFLVSGVSKLAQPRERLIAGGMTWVEEFSPSQIRRICILEILGAAGLVLPPALGVLEVLSPLAAAGLTGLMVGAAIVHLRRHETKILPLPLLLGAVSAVLAVLRFGPYAF